MTREGLVEEGLLVTGSGAVEVRPDLVLVELGAQAEAPDVQDAVREASAGLGRVREVLLSAGVEASDLRTTTTATWVEHGPEGQGAQRFVARLGVRARLRGSVLGDLDEAGTLVQDALAAAGGVARLDSTRFAIADPAAAAAAAREAAFADARAKAEQLAALAGRSLGAVASVTEGEAPGHAPARMALAAKAEALPLDGGEEVVSASVTVRWHWA